MSRAMLALCAGVALASFGLTGCRVNHDDVQRWESTANGPKKLRAVIVHDKYDTPLRVEAALALVRMKPRAGRNVGIDVMIEALASLPPETRQVVVRDLIPPILAELKKPPPVGQAGQPSPPDGSFAYKDAAFGMLSHDGTVIILDEDKKQEVKRALVDWAMADFEHRLDNRTQTYGMEQLLRFIGPSAVAGVPKLMTREAKRLDQMAGLVADLGDEKSKAGAAQAIVAITAYVVSPEWTQAKTPEVQRANQISGYNPDPKQLKAQLTKYQDEELMRQFASLKRVGTRPAVEFCLEYAARKEESETRRQAALAALENRIDRNNPEDIRRLIQIANSDAPDIVLDQVFRRVGELPRDQVVDKLYELFKTDKWKVRRAAGATVLKMSVVKHIDEFMAKLPEGVAPKGFAMPEAITFGAYLGDLKEGKPLDSLRRYFTSGGGAVRITALSYWLQFGTRDDLPNVQPFETDITKAPVCDTDPDCKWTCEVAKEGAADPTKDREAKDIKTVGEFVKYCVEPTLRERVPEPKK